MAVIRKFGKEYEYILEDDRDLPEAEQTKWIYKLPTLESQNLETGAVIMEGITQGANKTDDIKSAQWKAPNRIKNHTKIIKECLIRVENLKDDEGNIVEWPSANQARLQFIACLPSEMRTELSGVFLNGVSLSEEQSKNLSSVPA